MDTLTLHETRVLGALIEKEHTTPDSYPLSLNSLTLACNQKSNREPVLNLSQDQVQESVDSLVKKRLVIHDEHGSKRTAKIRHRFGNTEFSKVRFNPQQLAILTLLFLRGPQTPGELRTRTNRQCSFADVQAVEQVLDGLINHELHPFVVKLDRVPGQSACRYMHLFSGEVSASGNTDSPIAESTVQHDETLHNRVTELEDQVSQLQLQLTALQQQLQQLID